jgi:hypothetical protein
MEISGNVNISPAYFRKVKYSVETYKKTELK